MNASWEWTAIEHHRPAPKCQRSGPTPTRAARAELFPRSGDTRAFIAPDIPFELASADCFAKRDPLLERILAR